MEFYNKVLCFLDEHYYYDNEKEQYLSRSPTGNFLKAVGEKLGIRVDFLVPVKEGKMKKWTTKINEEENWVWRLPCWDSILKYYLTLGKNYFTLKKMIQKVSQSYELFWIRLPSPFGLWLGMEMEKKGKKVIYHVTGEIREAYKRYRLKPILKPVAWYLGHKERRIKYSKGVVLGTGSKLSRLYNGVLFIDSLIVNTYPPKEGILSTECKILYVGRIVKSKGIFLLVEVIEEIREQYQVELHIVGGGRDVRKLDEIIKGKDYIKFYGLISYGEELFKIYRKCDLLIMPTIISEGFPRVILEGWAHGLFVVSSKVGGVEGLGKDGWNLLFFEKGNKKELIEKIKLLIEKKEIQEKLKKGIKEVQKEITFHTTIEKIKKYFTK